MRGYKVERFIDKTMLLSSAESRFPIFNRLGGVLFVDVGRTYDAIDNISLGQFQYLFPDGGVRLHDPELTIGQRPLLGQDAVRNADLADVVQRGV